MRLVFIKKNKHNIEKHVLKQSKPPFDTKNVLQISRAHKYLHIGDLLVKLLFSPDTSAGSVNKKYIQQATKKHDCEKNIKNANKHERSGSRYCPTADISSASQAKSALDRRGG